MRWRQAVAGEQERCVDEMEPHATPLGDGARLQERQADGSPVVQSANRRPKRQGQGTLSP
jgi:hypothetical protein